MCVQLVLPAPAVPRRGAAEGDTELAAARAAPPLAHCCLDDCFPFEGLADPADDERQDTHAATQAAGDEPSSMPAWAARLLNDPIDREGAIDRIVARVGPIERAMPVPLTSDALAPPDAAGAADGPQSSPLVDAAALIERTVAQPRKPAPACAAERGALRVRALETCAAEGLARLEQEHRELLSVLVKCSAYFGSAETPTNAASPTQPAGEVPREALAALELLASIGALARAVDKCRLRAEAREAAEKRPAAARGWRRRKSTADTTSPAAAVVSTAPHAATAEICAAGASAACVSAATADTPPKPVGEATPALAVAEPTVALARPPLAQIPEDTHQLLAALPPSPADPSADAVRQDSPDIFALALLSPPGAPPGGTPVGSELDPRRQPAPVARLFVPSHARSPLAQKNCTPASAAGSPAKAMPLTSQETGDASSLHFQRSV
jgi:hypothetical protein